MNEGRSNEAALYDSLRVRVGPLLGGIILAILSDRQVGGLLVDVSKLPALADLGRDDPSLRP